LGLGFASKRVVERVQGKGNPLPGFCGDEIGRGTPTTAERRRRNAGVRAPATRVSYGLPDLAQKKEGGNAVLTEGSGRWMRDAGRLASSSGGELEWRRSWYGCWGGPLGSGSPRVVVWWCCGGISGVRVAGEPPAARNCTVAELTFGGCQANSWCGVDRRGERTGRQIWAGKTESGPAGWAANWVWVGFLFWCFFLSNSNSNSS